MSVKNSAFDDETVEPGSLRSQLVREVVCPNCWERFAPERVWYVASHPGLYGDLLLGENALRRFLPTRFHPDGRALDSKGSPCHLLACPRCHLPIPRVVFERPTLFMSIFGSPSSGKSYLLATMTHQLRKTLPRAFAMDFSDADPESNSILHGYEDKLFGVNENDFVSIQKTEEVGDWYQKVTFDTKEIQYPKPFFFQLSPTADHVMGHDAATVARTLCLYDNAGESFQPGADKPDNPVTQHMARANCLMFVFDPTQEPEFRKACRGSSNDPQMSSTVVQRQEVLLAEAARRVKIYRGLPTAAVHDRPLVVIVTKYDAWKQLVGNNLLDKPWAKHATRDFSVLRVDAIMRVSQMLRTVLRRYVPQIVSTAESFVDPAKIIYLPVSATGGPPKIDEHGNLRHRAGDIKPMWTEVPLLYVLSQFVNGLIPFVKSPSAAADDRLSGKGIA